MKDQYWCSATIGDGGLYSSVNDLKKWAMYLSKSENFIDMKIPNYINEEEYNELFAQLNAIRYSLTQNHKSVAAIVQSLINDLPANAEAAAKIV